MNNPMNINNPFQIMRALQNPGAFIKDIMLNGQVNDPRARKAMELYQNHDSKGLQTMAENICKEYGTTPEAVFNSLPLPRA